MSLVWREADALAEVLDVPRPDVRGHDDDRVAEVHAAAEAVGQDPVVEHLEQDVEHVGVRLLDLVEEHDGVRLAADLLGQLAALLVADVAGRRADEARHGELLHVLRHVDADERVLAVEEVLRQPLRELGLADARGAEEDERADGPLRVFEPGARPADGPRELLDGLVLPDDRALERLAHLHELLRPRCDEILSTGMPVIIATTCGDVGVGHVVDLGLGLALPLFLRVLELLLELLLLVAEPGGFLELLALDDLVLLLPDGLDLLFELDDLLAAP